MLCDSARYQILKLMIIVYSVYLKETSCVHYIVLTKWQTVGAIKENEIGCKMHIRIFGRKAISSGQN